VIIRAFKFGLSLSLLAEYFGHSDVNPLPTVLRRDLASRLAKVDIEDARRLADSSGNWGFSSEKSAISR
jgi:hypothetical protein